MIDQLIDITDMMNIIALINVSDLRDLNLINITFITIQYPDNAQCAGPCMLYYKTDLVLQAFTQR